jgi:malate dehydrogenase
LSHINTNSKVTGYKGDAELGAALQNAEIIVIPAGVPVSFFT